MRLPHQSLQWGIPVDFDPKHVVYVWLDALYQLHHRPGLHAPMTTSCIRKYWPADVHLVGKEIVRFHTIIWPIMLHGAGICPCPSRCSATAGCCAGRQ